MPAGQVALMFQICAALAEAYTSPEHKEAIAAFMEKREPDFKAARGGAS